jgi:hypothetical protein
VALVLLCDEELYGGYRELTRALDDANRLDRVLRRGVLRVARCGLRCARGRSLSEASRPEIDSAIGPHRR